jgi:hypothetical protein
MVGVDKSITTPEGAKPLFSAKDANRIVPDRPSWAFVRLLRQTPCQLHQGHKQYPSTTAADECD